MRWEIMYKKEKITLHSKLEGIFGVEAFRKFDKEFFIAFTLLATSSILIFVLTQYIITQNNNVIDYKIFTMVSQMTNPTGVKIAKIVTILGTGNFLIPAYILLLAFLTKRNYTSLFYKTSITATSGLLLGWLLKWIFHRTRPLAHLVSGAGGYSFPSGHALGGFIFSGIVLYLIWKMKFSYFVRWFCSILISLLGFFIGMSRVYLHVHYMTDVLGSFLIAIWWLSLMHILFRILFKNSFYKVNELKFSIN
jgi:undecaprenyl-diphosphatase